MCIGCFWGEYISPYFCLLSFLVRQQRAEEEARLERKNRLRLEREAAEAREEGLRREAEARRREVPGWLLRPTLNWRSLLNDIMGPISGGVHPFFSHPLLLLCGGSNSPRCQSQLSISIACLN